MTGCAYSYYTDAYAAAEADADKKRDRVWDLICGDPDLFNRHHGLGLSSSDYIDMMELGLITDAVLEATLEWAIAGGHADD